MILPLLLACTLSPNDPPPGVTDSASTTPSTTDDSTPPTDSPADSPTTGDDSSTPTDTDTTPTDTAPDPRDVDDDGDGYTERQGDCDDAHASVNPAMEEDCATRADDDCDGETEWDGCLGYAYWKNFGRFDWDAADPEPSGEIWSYLTGFIDGRVLCGGGGTFAESPDPTPACPDCVWTFRNLAALEDEWETPCDDIIVRDATASVDYTWLEEDWGFTYVDPATGAAGAGWLVYYSSSLRWEPRAGYGSVYAEYAFRTGAEDSYAYWSTWAYAAGYEYYWRYGAPTRDYNP